MKCLGTIILSDISGWPWLCPKVTMFVLRGIIGPVQLRHNLMPPFTATFDSMFHYLPNGKQEVILDSMIYVTE